MIENDGLKHIMNLFNICDWLQSNYQWRGDIAQLHVATGKTVYDNS